MKKSWLIWDNYLSFVTKSTSLTRENWILWIDWYHDASSLNWYLTITVIQPDTSWDGREEEGWWGWWCCSTCVFHKTFQRVCSILFIRLNSMAILTYGIYNIVASKNMWLTFKFYNYRRTILIKSKFLVIHNFSSHTSPY